jgi:hypothetical protein
MDSLTPSEAYAAIQEVLIAEGMTALLDILTLLMPDELKAPPDKQPVDRYIRGQMVILEQVARGAAQEAARLEGLVMELRAEIANLRGNS